MEAPHQQPKATSGAEERAKKLFLGSLFLTILVLAHLFYLAGKAGGVLAVIETFLPAVLLWSLVMTSYSFYVVHDVAHRRGLQIGASFTDAATGVFTLEYLKSCLENERRRVEQANAHPAVVAYVDLVHLDGVNRVFGHAVGDIVLKSVAQQIAGNARPGDIVGRVGGDEFLVVMPETQLEQAQQVVASIEAAIKGFRFDMGKRGGIDFLGCHAALAVFPDEGRTSVDIIAAAREKLPRLLSAARQQPARGAPEPE